MYTRQATWTDANDNNDERISEPMSISRDTIDVITFSSSLFFIDYFSGTRPVCRYDMICLLGIVLLPPHVRRQSTMMMVLTFL